MEKEQYIAGLDIGTTKIAVVVAHLDKNKKVKIVSVGHSKSTGVKRGVVSNITETVNSIKQAIKQTEENTGITIKKVVAGIAGKHIRSLQHNDYIVRKGEITNEVIKEEDIEKLRRRASSLVLNEGEKIIHVLPQDFKVDGHSYVGLNPIGMYGSRVEANFHIVVGQNASIKNIKDCVKRAGLELEAMVLEPIASSDAVLTQEEKEAGVVLVDIGGGTTDLAIFKDRTIKHTAVLDMGGTTFTQDIKEGFSIIEKYAENIKVRYGSAWPGEIKENTYLKIPKLLGREDDIEKEINLRSLANVIYARVEVLSGLIESELKNYGHNENSKKLIGGIVLTGGGSMIKHIAYLLKALTGMTVRIGYPNNQMGIDIDDKLKQPMYATSIGLAINAVEIQKKYYENQNNKETSESSNIPSDQEQKNEYRKKTFLQYIFDGVKHILEKAE